MLFWTVLKEKIFWQSEVFYVGSNMLYLFLLPATRLQKATAPGFNNMCTARLFRVSSP